MYIYIYIYTYIHMYYRQIHIARRRPARSVLETPPSTPAGAA